MRFLCSKDVAEMLGKRHDNLLREIRKYITKLGEEATDYFVAEGTGKRITYKVTLAGCELLGARLIGEAGREFKSWYLSALGGTSEEPVKEVIEYTVQEVAEMLGISERSIYRNIQSGKLESYDKEIMVPQVKKYISKASLERFKKERGTA